MNSLPNRRRPFAAAAASLVLLLLAAGCPKPPAEGGPPGSFPVTAIVAPVKAAPLEQRLSLVGTLAAFESVDIRSETDARIREVLFEEGAVVAAEKPLFKLDDSKLQAQLAEAAARQRLAQENFERSSQLLANNTISRQEFDQAQSELNAASAAVRFISERQRDTVINAPFAGRTTRRLVSPGQYVTVGQVLVTLIDADPIKSEFSVPERYLGQLSLGQTIELESVAYPDRKFTGKVTFISPSLSPTERTVAVLAEVANPEGLLKPGMFGRVELIYRAKDEAIVIPESAITFQGDATSVWAVTPDNKTEARPVTVGLRLAGQAEILSGLKAGDRIIVEGGQKAFFPGQDVVVSPESARFQ